MSEDQYRKLERSPPPERKRPPRVPKKAMPLGLGRLFQKPAHVYIGLTVFFVLGASIGGYLGTKRSAERPPKQQVSQPAPQEVVASTPASKQRNVNVRAYAYTTPTEAPTVSNRKKDPVVALRPRVRPDQQAPLPPSAPTLDIEKRSPESPTSPAIEKPKTQLAYAPPNTKNLAPVKIAIVIDDLGIDQTRTRNAIALPGPLTMAFLPYGYNLRSLTTLAQKQGHELIVHLPMQPQAADANPGPNALLKTLEADEIRSRIAWNLSQFDGYIGVNNHMGSEFTTWKEGMSVVLQEMKIRGLLYLDSLTSAQSVAASLAAKEGVPVMIRDVFLDNKPDVEQIKIQLIQLEQVARRRGFAIGIGHPYDATVEALKSWLATLTERGITLVPLSKVRDR